MTATKTAQSIGAMTLASVLVSAACSCSSSDSGTASASGAGPASTLAGGNNSGGSPAAGPPTAGASSASGGSTSSNGSGGGTAGGTAGATGGSNGGGNGGSSVGNVDRSDPQMVCARWQDAIAKQQSSAWTGNWETCDAGDPGELTRTNALVQINVFRFLAGLPAVDDDAVRNRKAQECALIAAKNGLNHNPPPSAQCYTKDGAEAASKSNEGGTGIVPCIANYMEDVGNLDTLGHRRWILATSLGPVGLGSVHGAQGKANCLWVTEGSGKATNAWTAWPPPGPFPSGALSTLRVAWSVHSNGINLSNATVEVKDGEQALAVDVKKLPNNFGDTHAIGFVPQGWTPAKGHEYRVKVSNIATPIEYSVQVIDCG